MSNQLLLMCSVIKWSGNDNNAAVVVAGNINWLEDMKTNLWLFPSGMNRVIENLINNFSYNMDLEIWRIA